MRYALALLPLLAACGSSPTPTAPTPIPAPVPPAPITITATLANTVTGATIGQHVQTVNGLPAQVTIAQAGYVTRQTWASSAEPRIDLFPEAGFDLAFYRQFARNGLDGSIQPLRVLAQSPSIYLQTAGLSAANVAVLEAAAREAVSAFSGGRLQVVAWETGAEARAPRAGWITTDVLNDSARPCGQATVGQAFNRIWLNIDARCHRRGFAVYPNGFAHEIGHALGFWHVTPTNAIMNAGAPLEGPITALERHHGALAYTRQAGNIDVDSDSRTPSTFQDARIIVD